MQWCLLITFLTLAVGAVSAASASAASTAVSVRIGGTAKVGSSLTVSKPAVAKGQTIAWQRCSSRGASCVGIARAAGRSYRLVAADAGHRLRAKVTVKVGKVTRTGYSAVSAIVTKAAVTGGGSTTPTPTPAPAPIVTPVTPPTPSLSGVARVGSTLVATDTWAGTPALGFQWRRCSPSGDNCNDIGGATASTYLLSSVDAGSTIRVAAILGYGAYYLSSQSAPSAVVTVAPPVNTGAPTITGYALGVASLGSTQGTWTTSGSTSYTRQWQHCSSSGSGCADIAGATDETLAITADLVAGTVRLVVTATNGGGSVSATSSTTGTLTATRPRSVTAPTVSGGRHYGSVLTTTNGTWSSASGITYGYAWQHCTSGSCTTIAGATASTYTTVTGDTGSTIRSTVTATNAVGATSAASTDFGPINADLALANLLPPATVGVSQETLRITLDEGIWNYLELTYTYAWQRCDTSFTCTAIPGATGSGYVPTAADVGFAVRAQVTGHSAIGGDATVASLESGIITAAVAPSVTAAPVVTGPAEEGQELSVDDGTWVGTDPITYAVTWQRCTVAGSGCVDITGAHDDTYLLASADIGSTVRARVVATNGKGVAAAASDVTVAVLARTAPVSFVAPTIAGTGEQGSSLVGDTGTWHGAMPQYLLTRWLRCDLAGSNCTPILGATTTSYDLGAIDIGTRLKLQVTSSNALGSTVATSLASPLVYAWTAPSNVTPPSVNGRTQVGEDLTVGGDAWAGTATITTTYQWQRCTTQAGTTCVDVPGAHDTTYTLVTADIGSHMRAVATATNAVGSASINSGATFAVTGPTAPVNTALPTATGDATETQVLTAAPGSWNSHDQPTYTFTWTHCNATGGACTTIPGATDPTYTLPLGFAGTTVRVVVAATNAAGTTTATAPESAVIAAAVLPAQTVESSISGFTAEGYYLSTTDGTWTGTATIGYAYQWLRCDAAGATCTDVPGATANSYLLDAADVGHAMRVRITASNGAGATPSTSRETRIVALDAGTPSLVNLPTVSTDRDPESTETIQAAVGDWASPTDYGDSLRWLRCNAGGTACVAIVGATSSSYVLTTADIGHTIRVRDTATNDRGSSVASSAATKVVIAARVPDLYIYEDGHQAPPPYIEGVASVGEFLSGSTSTWDGATPVQLYTRWLRCDAAGNGCANLVGELDGRYYVTAADAGSTIRFEVRAVNAAGEMTLDSTQTAVVS